jgi:uncharacterized Ntn-hydrolase superfamily protein
MGGNRGRREKAGERTVEVTVVKSQEQPPKSEGSPNDKLVDEHPQTLESINNLIDLYDAWNKTEEAEEWRTKLTEMEAVEQ